MGRMEGCRGAPQVLSRSRTTPRQHMSEVAQSPGVGPQGCGVGYGQASPQIPLLSVPMSTIWGMMRSGPIPSVG